MVLTGHTAWHSLCPLALSLSYSPLSGPVHISLLASLVLLTAFSLVLSLPFLQLSLWACLILVTTLSLPSYSPLSSLIQLSLLGLSGPSYGHLSGPLSALLQPSPRPPTALPLSLSQPPYGPLSALLQCSAWVSLKALG